MKLLFIRHGEPDYSIDSLTPKGWREAELLAKRLAGINNVVGSFCSPLGRAKDTAIPTVKATGMQPEILPWLKEFRATINDPETGELRIPWDLKPRYWKDDSVFYDETAWTAHPLMQTGTVSVAQVYEETCRGIDELLARYGYVREGRMYHCSNNREGVILLFCHMAVAMAAIGHLTGVSPFMLWHTFCMPPTGVTTMVTEERQPGIVSFRCFQMGDTSHLALGGETPSRMAMFPEVYNGVDDTRQT